jgi:hypothetical protein
MHASANSSKHFFAVNMPVAVLPRQDARGTLPAPVMTAPTAQEMEDAYGGMPYSAPGQNHHAKVVIDLEDTCRGAQRTISLKMPVLDASGHAVLKSRTLDVSIPRDVHGGQHLPLAGQEGAGFSEECAGNLYLEIELRQHELFRVDGHDVTIDVPVAPWEVAVGARITVPTPDGAVEGRACRLCWRPPPAPERQGHSSQRSSRHAGRPLCATEHHAAVGRQRSGTRGLRDDATGIQRRSSSRTISRSTPRALRSCSICLMKSKCRAHSCMDDRGGRCRL